MSCLSFSLLLFSEMDCTELVSYFFFRYLVELPVNTSGLGTSCSGRFLMLDSISLIDINLFRLPSYPCVGVGRLCLSRVWSISSRLSNLQHKVVDSVPLLPSNIYGSVVVAHLSFLRLIIWVFSLFFLGKTWLKAYKLYWSF